MKVKELVARLLTLDQEAEIYTDYDSGYDSCDPYPIRADVIYPGNPGYVFLTDEAETQENYENWVEKGRPNAYNFWDSDDDDPTGEYYTEMQVKIFKEIDRTTLAITT